MIWFKAPCSSNPCENNGKCQNNGDTYDCDCPNGFDGLNCEISKA